MKIVALPLAALSLMVMPICSATAQGRGFVALNNGTVAVLDGPITDTSASEFSRLITQNPNLSVLALNSPGGRVHPAIEISAAVRSLGLSTVIMSESMCASACSIIFFSGAGRLAEGMLGVHQMSNGTAAGVQYALADILDGFERDGVDRRISRHMLTTPPDDMYYFRDDEKDTYGINRSTAESVIAEPVARARAAVDFASYLPERQAGPGKEIVFPDFDGRDNWARSYRTRIRNGMSEGVNFAGHYNLIEIGCGTSCRFAFVGDIDNGEVFNFPYGGEEQYEMSLLYNPDSRLVKVTWYRDENTCIAQDLAFDGSAFEVVAETTHPRDLFCN